MLAVVGVAFGVRMYIGGATGSADGRLVVRNQWSTASFARTDITGAVVDRARGRMSAGQAVWLELAAGGRHRIDVTEVPFRGPSGGRLDRDLEAVRTWLAGRPHPSGAGDTH